jgi:hypothetical protein
MSNAMGYSRIGGSNPTGRTMGTHPQALNDFGRLDAQSAESRLAQVESHEPCGDLQGSDADDVKDEN